VLLATIYVAIVVPFNASFPDKALVCTDVLTGDNSTVVPDVVFSSNETAVERVTDDDQVSVL
jgi:hypothetical protein